MSKSWISVLLGVGVSILTLLGGCSLISLEELAIITYPAERGEIIQPGQELWIEFSVPPRKEACEHLFTVRRENTTVEGDYRWEGDRLFFTPAPELLPGVRYLLTCRGTVETMEKGSHEVALEIPFFCGSSAAAPTLLSSRPGKGETASITASLTLRFSSPMDTARFEEVFTLTPETGYSLTWNNEKTTACIEPLSSWEPHTLYQWGLASKATNRQGVPLAEPYSGSFITQKDNAAPELLGYTAARLTGNSVIEQDGFATSDAIQLTFSEDVSFETLQSAFTITPGVSGSFWKTQPGIYVYIPEERYRVDTTYVVTISTELLDRAGNALENRVSFSFTPLAPQQLVDEIQATGTSTVTLTSADFTNSTPTLIDFTGIDNLCTFVITFAEPYEQPYRSAITETIRIEGHFPTLLPPQQEAVSWNPAGDVLTLVYSGFEKSPSTPQVQRNLYKLIIPGGRETSGNQNGSYLTDDVWVVLEGERE